MAINGNVPGKGYASTRTPSPLPASLRIRCVNGGPLSSSRRAAPTLLFVVLFCLAAIHGDYWFLYDDTFEPPPEPSSSSSSPLSIIARETMALEEWDSEWKDPHRPANYAILVACTSGFYSMWLNWLEHYKRLDLSYPVVLFGEDDKTHERCLHDFENQDFKFEVRCLAYAEVFPHVAALTGTPDEIANTSYNKASYNIMMTRRPEVIMHLLLEEYDIFFSDVDTIWLKNPFLYFDLFHRDPNHDEVHIWAQLDLIKMKSKMDYLCAGNTFYKYSPETIHVVALWGHELRSKPTLTTNQRTFNLVLHTEYQNMHGHTQHFKSKGLPTPLFPSGRVYIEMSPDARKDVVIIHMNYGKGEASKRKIFIQYGVWLLDDEPKPYDPANARVGDGGVERSSALVVEPFAVGGGDIGALHEERAPDAVVPGVRRWKRKNLFVLFESAIMVSAGLLLLKSFSSLLFN